VRGWRGEGGGGRQGGEMPQTMYAHMNKLINKPKKENHIYRRRGQRFFYVCIRVCVWIDV
jgi:hypothetical protein